MFFTGCVLDFTSWTEIAAKIHRRYDGYPIGRVGVLADLQRFFSAVERSARHDQLTDPNYLAAQYVVWQTYEDYDKYAVIDGVRIVMSDPGGLRFRYSIDCHTLDRRGYPTVTYEEV